MKGIEKLLARWRDEIKSNPNEVEKYEERAGIIEDGCNVSRIEAEEIAAEQLAISFSERERGKDTF